MPIDFSNKVILITEKPRVTSPVRIALNQMDLEISTDYPALSSISLMRKGIGRSGKTAFIRTELLRFIKEKGFPRAVIIDSQIDLGMGPEEDPGMLKILKTLLIAFIILSKGSECRSLRGNFILLTKGTAFDKEFKLGTNPHGVIDMLATQNPEIQYFIDELRGNRERFDALFSFLLLDTDLSSDLITENIVNFLNTKSRGETAGAPDTKDKPATEKTADETAARIVYRIDSGSVYDDGSIMTDLNEEHASLKEREFYVIGTWSSSTELEVSIKIQPSR